MDYERKSIDPEPQAKIGAHSVPVGDGCPLYFNVTKNVSARGVFPNSSLANRIPRNDLRLGSWGSEECTGNLAREPEPTHLPRPPKTNIMLPSRILPLAKKQPMSRYFGLVGGPAMNIRGRGLPPRPPATEIFDGKSGPAVSVRRDEAIGHCGSWISAEPAHCEPCQPDR